MEIRFSTFTTSIGMNAFFALLAVHHALHSTDREQAIRSYNVSGRLGLVWC
jgi:hypothetical protein